MIRLFSSLFSRVQGFPERSKSPNSSARHFGNRDLAFNRMLGGLQWLPGQITSLKAP